MPAINYPDSWVELANQAIARIGKPPISALTDGTPTAGFVNTYLGEVIDSVCGLYGWHGIAKQVELARLSTTPLTYDYAYQIPADFVRPVDLGVAVADDAEYVIYGDQLLTDGESVTLTYVARPDDPAKIPKHIYLLIVAALAIRLTTPLIASETIIQRLASEYNDQLVKSRRTDASWEQDWTLERERGFSEYGDLR